MNHHIMVGKPIKKGNKVVGFEDVLEIPSNETFNYNRRGYARLQSADIAALKKTPAKPAAAKPNDSEDLNKLTVKQLRVIAEPLGAQGRLKADLIASIETARDELAAAD